MLHGQRAQKALLQDIINTSNDVSSTQKDIQAKKALCQKEIITNLSMTL